MAGRSSTSYQKRQKELARQDKQRAKAARREQRKLERQRGGEVQPADSPDESISTQEQDSNSTNSI